MNSLAEQIAVFDPATPLAAASTPPAAWYLRREFLELETRAVFRRTWQAVGRMDQVARPGDYFTGNLVGEPFVVLRDGEGLLRAFVNVCCHHAAEVAAGEGFCQSLVCPYHGWTYDLTGRLRSAPKMGRVENFDVSAMGLKPLAVEAWGPLVFLHLDPDPRPPEAEWPELHARLAASGFERLRFVARRTYEVACNWKVFVDNYLDGGYHVGHLHRGLAGQLDLGGYRTEIFERFSIQSCSGGGAATNASDAAGQDFAARIGDGAIYAWLYPNFMINRYGPIMDTNWVVPLAVDRTLTVFDYFFHESVASDETFIADSLAASDQVQQEDIGICESVQRGLGSSAYDRGRYAAPEAPMHEFHKLLARDLAADCSKAV